MVRDSCILSLPYKINVIRANPFLIYAEHRNGKTRLDVYSDFKTDGRGS